MGTKLTKRVSYIEDSIRLLGFIADRLKYLAPSIGSIVDGISGQFRDLVYPVRARELMMDGLSFPESWRQAVGECAGQLGEEESRIIVGLANILGCVDLDSQLSSIDYVCELLRTRLERVREDEKKYTKLYRTLGVLCGIILVIIMI